MAENKMEMFYIDDWRINVKWGEAGDTQTGVFETAQKRSETAHIRIICYGRQHMELKPPGVTDPHVLTAGMDSDMLPDIVAGPYQFVYDEPGMDICVTRKDFSDFEFERVTLEPGQKFTLPKGRLLLFAYGELEKDGVKVPAQQVIFARNGNTEFNVNEQGKALMVWA